MPKVKTQPRCAWELCNKKLIDLAFICKADGRLFCDETCCERAPSQRSISWLLARTAYIDDERPHPASPGH
jgi:hypothetical protein